MKEPVAEPVDEVDLPEAPQRADEPAEQETEDANASQQIELSAGDSANVDDYLTRLSRHLSQFYEYPRRARRLGQQGAPVIVFEFSRNGTLIDHSLRKSSGHDLLDDAAIAMLEEAAPLPEVPESMAGNSFRYALPVRFSLR